MRYRTYMITFICILLTLFTLNVVHAPVGGWIIEGDKVYVNDSFVYISAEPRTIVKDGWVVFNVTSKVYTGDVDIVLGLDIPEAVPKAAGLYSPEEKNQTYSYTCAGFFNYTLTPRHFYCYDNNATPKLVYDRNFEWGDIPSKTAYWNISYLEEWKDISGIWDSIDYEYGGMNKWWYKQNIPIVANVSRVFRVYIELEKEYKQVGSFAGYFPKELDKKYWFAIKPSSETIPEAVASDHLYALDPWINSSGTNMDLSYLTTNLIRYYGFQSIDNVTEDLYGIDNLSKFSGTPKFSDINGINGKAFNVTIGNKLNTSQGGVWDFNTSSMSFIVWFRQQAGQAGYTFAMSNPSIVAYIGNEYGAPRFYFHTYYLGTAYDNQYPVYNDKWYMFVYTRNDTSGTIYMNGSLFKTGSEPTFSDSDIQYFVFGGHKTGTGSDMYGQIDEIALFNRSLNASEVNLLWNDGKGIFYNKTYGAAADTTYPTFSSYWDSNSTLINQGIGYFNVTVADSNGTVVLEINNTNISAYNFAGNLYNISYNFSMAGTYAYRWHSWGSGADHLYNRSAEGVYTVVYINDLWFNAGFPYETKSFRVTEFINKSGNNFTLGGVPYHLIGADSYYMADYATNHTYDDNGNEINNSQQYVLEILNEAHYLNINVIRTWAGMSGSMDSAWIVNKSGGHYNLFEVGVPGNYSEEMFKAMDWVLYEAGKRDIRLQMVLINNWYQYGGMDWYVNKSTTANHSITGDALHDQFYNDSDSMIFYRNYINYTLNRNNTYSGVLYKDDPTIFAWLLANEPRAKSADPTASKGLIRNWTINMTAHIKSIDTNHLVGLGIEGFGEPFEGTDMISNHNGTGVDFATFELHPEQWDWLAQRSENVTNAGWIINGINSNATIDWWTNGTGYSWNNRWEGSFIPNYKPALARHGYQNWIQQNVNWSNQLNLPVLLQEVAMPTNLNDPIKNRFYQQVIHNFFKDGGEGVMLWNLNHDNYYYSTTPVGIMDDGYSFYVSDDTILKNKSQSVIDTFNFTMYDNAGGSWVTYLNNYKYDFTINVDVLPGVAIDNCTLNLEIYNGTFNNVTQVNSSAIIPNTNYIFTKQFVSSDNNFTWYAECCGSGTCVSSSISTILLGGTGELLVTLMIPNNSYKNSPVNLIYNVTNGLDISRCELYINNVLNATDTSVELNINQTFSINLSDNVYDWHVKCIDIWDSVGTSETRNFTVDSTFPNINITYPFNTTYNINVNGLNYTYNDTHPDSCWYSNNSGIWNSTKVSAGTNFTSVTSTEGSNIWTLYCNDSANNINSSSITFFRDMLPPTITLISPLNHNYTKTTSWNFTALLTDAGIGLKNTTFRINNPVASYNITRTIIDNNVTSYLIGNNLSALLEGVYNWSYDAYDNLDNYAISNNYTLTVDLTPPTISWGVGTLDEGVNVSQSNVYMNVTWNETNFLGIIFYLNNAGPPVTVYDQITNMTPAYTANFTGVPEGYYYYEVAIVDKAGLVATTNPRAILLDTTAPTEEQGYTGTGGYGIGTNGSFTSNATTNFTANITDIFGIKNITITITNQSGAEINKTTISPPPGSFTVVGVLNYLLGLPVALIDGVYNWIVEAVDVAGNFVTSTYMTLFVDTTPPIIASQNTSIDWNDDDNYVYRMNATYTEDYLMNKSIEFNHINYTIGAIATGIYEYNLSVNLTYVPYNVPFYFWGYDNASNYAKSNIYYLNVKCPAGFRSFNNTYCIENLNFTGNQNITRYLSISNTVLTNLYLNLSGYNSTSSTAYSESSLQNITQWWKMENQLEEYTPSTYNLTAFIAGNSPTFSAGKVNLGTSFDGTNGWKATKYSNDLNFNGSGTTNGVNFTIAFWAKENYSTNIQTYLDTCDLLASHCHAGGWLIYSFKSKIWIEGFSSTAIGDSSVGNISMGDWNHIAITKNASHVCIYINGTKDTCVATTKNMTGTTKNLTMGIDQSATYKLKGMMDEVMIWNTTLTPGAISGLWDGTYFTTTTTSNSTNPYNASLRIGDLPVWNYSGEFRHKNNKTDNLASFVNQYLNSTYLFGSEYRVPFVFHSDTIGILRYLDLRYSNEGFLENSQGYSTPTFSGVSNAFTLNFTYDSVYYPGISANLIYNGTSYNSIITTEGMNYIAYVNLTAPMASVDSNMSFYWMLGLSNTTGIYYYNSTSYNQTILALGLDNCAGYNYTILNFTIKDEETLYNINGTIDITVKIYTASDPSLVTSYNASLNYTTSTQAAVCISNLTTSYKITYSAQYYSNASAYFKESANNQYIIISPTSIPQNVTLYDLLYASGTRYKILIVGNYYSTNDNLLIDVQRQHLYLDKFFSVESPVTSSEGSTTAALVSSSVIYNFIVSKDGIVLGTFNNYQVYCQNIVYGECILTLNLAQATAILPDFRNYANVSVVYLLDNATSNLYLTFSSTDGLAHTVNSLVFKNDGYGNNTICNNTATGTSGTLICNIPQTYRDTTFLAQLKINNKYITTTMFSFKETVYYYGVDIFMELLMFSTLVLLMIANPIMIVIGALLGFTFSLLLLFLGGSSITNLISVIVFYVIGSVIVIWQISKKT